MNRVITTGHSAPLGATLTHGGANFSIYSRNASRIDLLFDHEDDDRPARVIHLDPVANCSYYYWHIFVPQVQPGQIYAYRVAGPFDLGTDRARADVVERVVADIGRAGIHLPALSDSGSD